MNNIDFTVIVDTREQQPWTLKYHSSAIQKLDTGDYSVQGYEDLICIERKHSISEFVSNMSEKRFLDVLNRMTKYKYSYIVMEFNFDDVLNFPIGSDIPKKMWDRLKVSPAYITKYIAEIHTKYNIHVLFCGSPTGAEKMALSLMRRVVENEKK